MKYTSKISSSHAFFILLTYLDVISLCIFDLGLTNTLLFESRAKLKTFPNWKFLLGDFMIHQGSLFTLSSKIGVLSLNSEGHSLFKDNYLFYGGS